MRAKMVHVARGMTFALVLATVAVLGACVGTGGGSNNNGNNGPSNMNDEEQAAVDTSTEVFQQVAKTIGSATLSADPRNYQGSTLPFGDCPQVSSTLSEAIRTVDLDYGDGCQSALLGQATVSGNVTFTINATNRSVTIELNEITVNDLGIDGSIVGTAESFPTQGRVTIAGDLDLIFDIGAAMGEVTFTLNAGTGEILVSETTRIILADEDSPVYTVTAADIVIRPENNPHLIPQSGTLTIELPEDDEAATIITITFDDESPTTGVVTVQIGNAAAFEYALPFFEAP